MNQSRKFISESCIDYVSEVSTLIHPLICSNTLSFSSVVVQLGEVHALFNRGYGRGLTVIVYKYHPQAGADRRMLRKLQ